MKTYVSANPFEETLHISIKGMSFTGDEFFIIAEVVKIAVEESIEKYQYYKTIFREKESESETNENNNNT